jgi:hypothetical protein
MSIVRVLALSLVSTVLVSSQLPLAAQTTAQSLPNDGSTEVTFHFASDLSVDSPVKITLVMLGDKKVPLDTPVAVSGQWSRTVSIVAKNTTNKTIVFGMISLLYPESGSGNRASPVLASSLDAGGPPHHWYLKKDGTERPLGKESHATQIEVPPGDSMTFSCASVEGADHCQAAEADQAAVTKIAGRFTRVLIQPNKFYFADESMWQGGGFYLPVPPPEIWKHVPAEQFFAAPPERAEK